MVGVAKGGGAFCCSLDHAALAEVKTFYMGREGERVNYIILYMNKTTMYKISALYMVLRFLKLPIYHKDSAFTKLTENKIYDK